MVYGRRSGQPLPEAIHDNSDLVDALGSARVNILMKTWRNPVIADNYEPGSTFADDGLHRV